ncbi:MoaD/ThiS family protein [Lampropedia puyangensis]|uniref:MoaD/ThiS family protein n=1 Tax=Lampropedia puyangensis TaxID=1330072 RepID=A0A4S8EVE3_9BURK|nr:MoaD/ThiS family protein [Lampropedia puyangensis]THT98438.1 MoaD/ThiS family protein [Lampropedia puyangensis]
MITITYFGNLKQLLPSGEEQLAWTGGTSDELLAQLRARNPDWEQALAPERIFKMAINQQLLHHSVAIKSGDHVAILPPVTGG